MSRMPPYRGNDPIEEVQGEANESDDLKAIRRDMEIHRVSQEMWQHLYPDGDRLQQEFEQVAMAAQDWDAASSGQRFGALRILVKRIGREETDLLTMMAASKSNQSWMLSVRQRKNSEKLDGGKRDRKRKRERLAQILGEDVYLRIRAGQDKADAIEAVKEDYRTGAQYPQIGDFPAFNRPKLNLPNADGIEKLLGIFRRNARKRDYVDPDAPRRAFPVAREPDLKVSDIPKQGRPRKK